MAVAAILPCEQVLEGHCQAKVKLGWSMVRKQTRYSILQDRGIMVMSHGVSYLGGLECWFALHVCLLLDSRGEELTLAKATTAQP